jgi:hypothetical protein
MFIDHVRRAAVLVESTPEPVCVRFVWRRDPLEFSDLSRQVVTTTTITAEVIAWATSHHFDTREGHPLSRATRVRGRTAGSPGT